MSARPLDPRRWWVLGITVSAFFMTLLDATIVNVALPTIGNDLHFSRSGLMWVLTAYALTFGGFLLLAGRVADLVGRRAVLMAGIAVFAAASLICALSTSPAMLIVGRGVQGFGAALICPAALALVAAAFPEGSERTKALAIWGAASGSGGAAGVLLGGVLTKFLGWEWIFYVNIPVGAIVLLLALRYIPESKTSVARRRYDPLGALTITGALILLVFTISKAPDVGWGSTQTIVLLVVTVALFAAFIFAELRNDEPLLPFRIFRLRTVTGANVASILISGALVGMFFLLTLYVQQVLVYSALKAGVTFLAIAGMAVLAAGLAEVLVTRIGAKPVMLAGVVLLAAGLFYFTQISVDGSFATDLLPGYILAGSGLAFSFVPMSIAALAGIDESEEGLGSGLFNTSQQVGAAIAVAVVSTVFATRLGTELDHGTLWFPALVSSFRLGFWVLGGISVGAFVATLVLLRRADLPAHPQEAQAHRAAAHSQGLCWNRAATSTVIPPPAAGAGSVPAAQA